ncbi:hypothetical protein [Beijerinckia sp. L45]|uniref:hypothetical protein n=1 Tax=Beijerinckia sp. L45 TaxID=1641855 RepID=UPI00131B8463|nr:hypothetical protein [Beijerinckia sp. L45]
MLVAFRDRRTTFFAAALVCVALPSAAMAAGPLDPYLPKSGTIKGHVVVLEVAKEDQAISKQFQLAVQNNMDWFKHYVTNNKAGEPLPYNSKMGVTEAQYTQLLHMKPSLIEKAAIDITVNRGPDGRVAFVSSDPAAASLQGTTFPPDGKLAQTPFGTLTVYNAIHQKDENAPFGVWDGAEWAKVAADGADEPSVKIAFGKREPSGQGLFYYQVSPTKEKPEQSLVVTYPLD